MAELRTISAEPPGESIFDVLDRLRERAERGELSSIAVATVERDGSAGSSYSRIHNKATMLGSLIFLQDRLINE